jgi:alpha/beta superfamily hydrolase
MEIPVQLKTMLAGAAAGAFALAIVGFTWGGWVTKRTADTMARRQASLAVIEALAPICVANFRRDKDYAAELAALKKASSWEQGGIVKKAGWAKIPGIESEDTDVAGKCAALILAGKN